MSKSDSQAKVNFSTFNGKAFKIKKTYYSEVLNLDDSCEAQFTFLSSAELKENLLDGYGDYLAEIGISEDGSEWENKDIVPIGEVSTEDEPFGWVLLQNSTGKFFVTTTDRWELSEDFAFDKMDNFLNNFSNK